LVQAKILQFCLHAQYAHESAHHGHQHKRKTDKVRLEVLWALSIPFFYLSQAHNAQRQRVAESAPAL
jgi:hypothetical protein